MKLIYDPKHNIGYIHFREKPAQVETVHISEELNIDLAPDGTLYGIELLNANEQLAGGEVNKLVVEDPSTGTHSEILLPA